jgi:hypothetical protein
MDIGLDGTMHKLMDVSFINSLGWSTTTPFLQGMQQSYANYLECL